MPRIFLRVVVPVSLVAAALGACRGDPGPTREEAQARRNARLGACIAEELQIRARSDMAHLDTMLAQMETGDPTEPLLRAPHTFAQAYVMVADVRAHESAYVDSAFHAAGSRDSLRYEQMAATFRVNPPSPGTVEANVAERYEREFAGAWRNPSHPCHAEADRPRRPRR